MSRCIVVGGGGFIGRHLVNQLVARGDREIVALGRRPAPPHDFPKRAEYVSGSISDVALLSRLMDGADEVVDLAYSTVPKTSFDDPVQDVLANLPPTVTLLEVASRHKLRRLLLVSSGGTVYGDAQYLPIDELHPTNPLSPYGITKLAAEKYALMFSRLADLPVTIVRPGNAYGPGQRGDRGQGFIAAAMWSIMTHQGVQLFGERGTVRDYVYIDDVVDGLIASLDSGRSGSVYNIGTGVGRDNLAVTDALASVVGERFLPIEIVRQDFRAFDVKANVLCSDALFKDAKWTPKIEFPVGLERTWQWMLREQAT